MDIFTHSAAGLLIGAISVGKKDKIYPLLLTGVLASALPDLDAFIALKGVDFFYKWHRVFTHTVFAAPFIAALASAPAWIWLKGKYLKIYLVALTAFFIHLAFDVMCLWDIMLLYPLNHKSYALNLFGNKDTSLAVMAVVTIAAMAALFKHQKRLNEQTKKETANRIES